MVLIIDNYYIFKPLIIMDFIINYYLHKEQIMVVLFPFYNFYYIHFTNIDSHFYYCFCFNYLIFQGVFNFTLFNLH
jgi:hypothetical protein